MNPNESGWHELIKAIRRDAGGGVMRVHRITFMTGPGGDVIARLESDVRKILPRRLADTVAKMDDEEKRQMLTALAN